MKFESSDKNVATLYFTQLQSQQLYIPNQYSPNYDFQKNFLNYFPKSQLLYEEQNILALSVISKTTKQWSMKQRIDETAKRMSEILKPYASLYILLQCESILLL